MVISWSTLKGMTQLRLPLLFVLLMISLTCCKNLPEVEVNYFYASHCNECGDMEKRLLSMNETLKDGGAGFRVNVTLNNIITDAGFEAFEQALSTHDVGLTSRHAPLLFVESTWAYGEDIETLLSRLEEGLLPEGVSGE